MKKSYALALKVKMAFRTAATTIFFMVTANAGAQGFITLGTTGNSPEGIVIDAAGNVYTPNTLDNTVTKITPAGISTTFATTGLYPDGIAIDGAGNLYVTNNGSNTVTKITPAGVSSTFGTTGTNPINIAVDATGNVYTINSNNTVTKITPSGLASTFSTMVSTPNGIAIDGAGNVYVTNGGNNTVTKITPAGVSSTFGTTGNSPTGIAIDAAGNVYTVNSNSSNVSKITPAGVSSILATVSHGQAIAIDAAGNLFVTVNGPSTGSVAEITPSGTVTSVGTTGTNPYAIAIDAGGYIYTANSYSNNVSKSNATLLPITLLSFTGTKANNGNLLQWAVADALNFSHFELQRKDQNDAGFTLLKTIPFNNNTASYSYTDASATGINYYRLALVDLDGTVQYSSTIPILDNSSSIASIRISPNPVVVGCTILINGITDFSDAFITVANNMGETVTKKQVTQNATKLDFNSLPNGVYHIIYNDAAGNRLQTEVVK